MMSVHCISSKTPVSKKQQTEHICHFQVHHQSLTKLPLPQKLPKNSRAFSTVPITTHAHYPSAYNKDSCVHDTGQKINL
jgi:hypothetical protein